MMATRTATQLNPVGWLVIPALACALASVLLAVPVKVLGLQAPEPIFALVPAFAWPIVRPSAIAPFLLLGLGLFMDALWGARLGLWPIGLIATHAATLALRRVLVAQDVWSMGLAYAAGCALCFAVATLLSAGRSGEWPNLIAVGLQFVISVALFPLTWRLIERFEDADVRFR